MEKISNEELAEYIADMRKGVEVAIHIVENEGNKLFGFDDEAHDALMSVVELLRLVHERM